MQVAQKHIHIYIYIYIYNIKNRGILVNKQKLIDMLCFIKKM